MSSSTPKAVLALAKGEGAHKLTLSYQGKELAAGGHVPKADASQPPKLKYSGTPGDKYVAVVIDVDAPYESFNILSPILHWLQTELTADASGNLTGPKEHEASWIQPAPPPLSGPHKYIIVLYTQPASFDANKLKKQLHPLSMTKRIRWDLPAFVTLAGLGDPLAASYFTSN